MTNTNNELTFEQKLITKTKSELCTIAVALNTTLSHKHTWRHETMAAYRNESDEEFNKYRKENLKELNNQLLDTSYDTYEIEYLIKTIKSMKNEIQYLSNNDMRDYKSLVNIRKKYNNLDGEMDARCFIKCTCGHFYENVNYDGENKICETCKLCEGCKKAKMKKCKFVDKYNGHGFIRDDYFCETCLCNGYCDDHCYEFHTCGKCKSHDENIICVNKKNVCHKCVNNQIDIGSKRRLPQDILNLIVVETYDKTKKFKK